jgi:uncharacterized RDD family membrane protein YckC
MNETPVNPYQSPPETEPPPAQSRTVRMKASSGLGSRLLAAVLDQNVAAVLFLAAAMSLANDEQPFQVVPLGAALGSYLGYFFFTEWLLGGTPAKLFFRLQVRQLSGERCTVGQIAVRTVLRIVEINPLLLGGLPAGITILSTERRQRIGDLLAGTVVMRK